MRPICNCARSNLAMVLKKVIMARRVPVIASRDWHPVNHCPFFSQGGPWPPHCIQDTPGVAFQPDLELPAASERRNVIQIGPRRRIP